MSTPWYVYAGQGVVWTLALIIIAIALSIYLDTRKATKRENLKRTTPVPPPKEVAIDKHPVAISIGKKNTLSDRDDRILNAFLRLERGPIRLTMADGTTLAGSVEYYNRDETITFVWIPKKGRTVKRVIFIDEITSATTTK